MDTTDVIRAGDQPDQDELSADGGEPRPTQGRVRRGDPHGSFRSFVHPDSMEIVTNFHRDMKTSFSVRVSVDFNKIVW